jgi:hypothetical protein
MVYGKVNLDGFSIWIKPILQLNKPHVQNFILSQKWAYI